MVLKRFIGHRSQHTEETDGVGLTGSIRADQYVQRLQFEVVQRLDGLEAFERDLVD